MQTPGSRSCNQVDPTFATRWLPFHAIIHEDPDKIVEVLISWGRYAEYFGYNDNTKSIYLDVGQEVL